MTDPILTEALLESRWHRLIAVGAGLLFTVLTSGVVVRRVVRPTPEQATLRGGSVIGKCENLIAFAMVLLGEETGLAIIFAAKSLVRGGAIRESPENASYYLGGTLVNLVWSMSVALLVRAMVIGL